MNLGFEVTAAVPKRLRAAEDQPVAETMRGDRKITQAPSTDQKKVRRQMQRKTAAFTPHEHPETEEWHGSASECQGTMCTSRHNPENQREHAPEHIQQTLRRRFEDHGGTPLVHPSEPNTYISDPHNSWDGPTHVKQHNDNDFSFDGWTGHQHFDAEGRSAPCTCGKTASKVVVPGRDGDPDLHKGHWGDLRPGDHVVGLNGSRVETVEHVNRYGETTEPGHHTHVRMTFSNPDPLWHESGQRPRTEHRYQPVEHDMTPGLAFYRHSGDGQKTAANFSAGTCRMCEGNLIPLGQSSDENKTIRAQCSACGTKHELQNAEVKKTALPKEAIDFMVSGAKCPSCGDDSSRHQKGQWIGGRNSEGVPVSRVECKACGHMYDHAETHFSDYGRTAARHSEWVPVYDDTPYTSAPSMSAIARRAHSVLDTEETL